MPVWARVCSATAGGAVVGAIAFTLLVMLAYALFARQAFGDGQFFFVFLFTVPFGGMLGALASASLSLVRLGRPETAGWICLVGGTLLAVLSSLLVWARVSDVDGNFLDLLSSLISPLNGAPLVWAVALFLWGLQLLRKR